MKDIMIDLETLGTDQDSIFISIGATIFDLETSELGEQFYVNVDWQSSIDAGRTFTAATLKWWLKQSDEARQAILKDDCESLASALIKLSAFISEVKRPVVWGNGATFDISMLENAYKALSLNIPWEFWNVNDCRTIARIAKALGVTKDDFPPLEGTAHNALDDAIYQAQYISGMHQAITKGES